MSIQIQIDSGLHKDEQICFLVPETIDILEIVPAEKMITDSDKLSFVYLIDGESSYGQIHFPEAVWSLLVEVLKSETDPQLVQGEKSVVLTGFIEELTMLIFNIEGNNNYGEGFSTAVEQAFDKVLQDAK